MTWQSKLADASPKVWPLTFIVALCRFMLSKWGDVTSDVSCSVNL